MLVYLFLIAIVFAIANYLLPPIRSIPPSYLPTRWSDFGFWPKLISDALEEKARRALTILSRPDMIFGRLTDWCTWLSFMSIAAFCHVRNLLSKGLGDISLFMAAFARCVVCAFVPAAGVVVKWVGWIPDISLHILVLPILLYETLAVLQCKGSVR